ncbi:helix-turn-helix domain-containing protein [Clostridium perfringens]|uniref:helix-turn-helix domain-containing protein n=1 Tax=Clostridium perfringens TaxID=1502 RepID=UPI000F5465B1|nr:helix-turn-helix transcriptional regulator [Clostridium perfringens]BDC03438.1 hypothetical protein CP118TE_31470 [Clostridium perfringens E]
MKERIKKIRKDKKLSQVEFGNKLSVSRDAIANIECGRVDPKPLFINHLCDVFNVNREWILTGNGNMYIVPKKERELADLIYELSKSDSRIYKSVSALAQLDDEYLVLIENLITGLLETKIKKEDIKKQD